MQNILDRPWGINQDREAARQLGLEGDHTIFLMATECIDYIDDVRDILDHLDGVTSAEEVVDEIIARMKTVKLPDYFCLVGMKQVGIDGAETYGIVDWRMVKANSSIIQEHEGVS